jgi:hypothetical protein
MIKFVFDLVDLRRISILALLCLPIRAEAIVNHPTDPVGAPGSEASQTPNGSACARVNLCTGTPVYNGEAFAGPSLLWRTNFFARTLELYDVAACRVIRDCPAPGGLAPSELTMLNGILYHYDFAAKLLYGIDPNTCQVVYTCDPPGDDLAEGLTSDGSALWKGDSQNLYRFIPTVGGGCQVLSVCPNPAGDSSDGLSFCGEHLLMLGYSGNLYEIDPANCQVVGLCPLNLGASGNGIASDRNSILYVDDDTTLKLDRVDVGCDIPVPAVSRSWGHVKSLYR